jgi:hypothetical protein
MIKSIDHVCGFRSRLRIINLLSEIEGNGLVSSAVNPKQGNPQATRRFSKIWSDAKSDGWLARPILAEFTEKREASADIDGLPSDIAGFMRREKREHAGDLLGRSDTPERDVPFHNCALGLIAGPCSVDRRVDRTRPNGVDTNAPAAKFERQSTRQAGHAPLAD